MPLKIQIPWPTGRGFDAVDLVRISESVLVESSQGDLVKGSWDHSLKLWPISYYDYEWIYFCSLCIGKDCYARKSMSSWNEVFQEK
jgi:hypothetical protein